MDKAISDFLTERKLIKIKNKVKATMTAEEQTIVTEEIEKEFLLANWLPKAAKRTGQLALVSHPGKFSHPSAKTSTIIADCSKQEDGFLRSGNTTSELDVLGNAAAMDVYKFLSIKLEDGKTILQHLEEGTETIKHELGSNFEEVSENFLAIKRQMTESVTHGLVKQVYFPVDEGYHLLSILTPSGLMFELRNRIHEIRFSEKTKEARDSRKKQVYHERGFEELYDLSMVGYGGTKPQNISALNNTYGGKSYLLHSAPPSLKRQFQRLPKHNFFVESLYPQRFKNDLKAFHGLLKTDYNNINIRQGRDRRIQLLIEQVIEVMWTMRLHDPGWSLKEAHENLPHYQKIWLDQGNEEEREKDDAWLDKILSDFARWFVFAYEKVIGKQAILLADDELLHIKNVIEQNKEDLQ